MDMEEIVNNVGTTGNKKINIKTFKDCLLIGGGS
jgi:hypothetical protein